jgi:hypothetical protein
MKNLLLISLIISTVLLFGFIFRENDCREAYDYAEAAYSCLKKAYNSINLNDLKYYAHKAMDYSEDAQTAAKRCNCRGAYDNAEDTYNYSRKAYLALDFENGLRNVQKAIKAAKETMNEAEDCK